MNRPPLEVADLIRAAGAGFIQRSRQWIGWKHVKVLLAIVRCRTAALGGHLDQCTRCGHRATISYNSCRNRHCPKCQTAARERWIAARRQQLLPTRYVHAVFTLPAELAPLAVQNKKVVYDLFVSRQRRNPFWKSPAIPNIWALRLASSAFSIPGTRNLACTRMSDCVIAYRRPVSRWHALDQATPCFFLPVLVLSARVSRQVRCRSPTSVPGRPTQLPRKSGTAWAPRRRPSPPMAKTTGPKRLGGLRQTALRRPGLCAPVSGPLHPPRGHLQPSPGLVCGWQSHFPLARLRSPQRTEVADPIAGSILAPLPVARASQRLRPHSELRLAGRNRRRATLLPLCFHLLGSAPQTEQELSIAHDAQEFRLCPHVVDR